MRIEPRRIPVTLLLIAINLAAFAYEVSIVGSPLLMGGGSLGAMIDAGALVPSLARAGQYWRIVTGAFLHGGLLHLAVNMYSLYVLGPFIEIIAGRSRMAIIYAISLVASGVAVMYFSSPFAVTVGASGAIFGLFGALFAIGFKMGLPGMRLVRANVGILVLNLFITFAVPGIAASAHVGGLIAGFVVACFLYARPEEVARV